jgi:DNA (cytosine-5)-methyltransferase 1
MSSKSTRPNGTGKDIGLPPASLEPITQARRNKAAIAVTGFSRFPDQPPIYCNDDGVSVRLDRRSAKHREESIVAYGNAIVPSVALQIFKAIQAMDSDF